ncbi:MAG: peptide chain release factor N(5)-glutamine methyltransferase [Clostridia bacterium]|nr:peptide chain release factor N(5)-glutamine methyltransferase [Clostridia bacterium]
MTYAEATARLAAAGIDSPAYDAAQLIAHFCGADPASLPFAGEEDFLRAELADAVARRAAREPLQYILGEWDFWRQTYRVAPGCLIPRADTELLVDYAARHLPPGGRLLDLCTGSGCIAISTLAERPDCTGDAVDFFPVPLALAAENAARNGVADRLNIRYGDVLHGEGADGLYACILSNPPYIEQDVIPTLSPELAHEPASALDGGADGLCFYRAILQHYRRHLAPGGCFIFEIGYNQADALRALAKAAGMSCVIRRDFGGCDRMAILGEQEDNDET